mgnify:CR=1 FL=1
MHKTRILLSAMARTSLHCKKKKPTNKQTTQTKLVPLKGCMEIVGCGVGGVRILEEDTHTRHTVSSQKSSSSKTNSLLTDPVLHAKLRIEFTLGIYWA